MKEGLTPRGVYETKLRELQRRLMDDDCWLPGFAREMPALTREAALECGAPDAENLRNGVDRPTESGDNGVTVAKGEAIAYRFAGPKAVSRVRIVFDSDLNRATLPEQEVFRHRNMMHNRPLRWQDAYVPKTMVRAFRVEGVAPDGSVHILAEETNNYQRLRRFAVDGVYTAVRLIPLETWGNDQCHVFVFEVE